MSRIAVIVGHSRQGTLCEALGEAYAKGAREAGHSVDLVVLSQLSFDPVLREGYERIQPLEPDLKVARDAIYAADHIVIVFPLWLGDMPAILKGFLERFLQPDLVDSAKQQAFVPLLKGKSARIIVTMGMPGLVYRLYFGPHALRILSGNILGFVGVAPIRWTIHGRVANVSDATRRSWISDAAALGRQAR